MNDQEPKAESLMWQALADSLEDECEDVLTGIGDASMLPTAATHRNAHAKSSAKSAIKTDEQNDRNQVHMGPQNLQLRKWIQHATQISGKKSGTMPLEYLKPAINIAMSLAEQLAQAEKLDSQYGISRKLDLLPIDKPEIWAVYTFIHLNADSDVFCKQQERNELWEPLQIGCTDKVAADDEQLNSFLRESVIDEVNDEQSTGEIDVRNVTNTNNDQERGVGDSIKSFLVSFEKAEAAKQRYLTTTHQNDASRIIHEQLKASLVSLDGFELVRNVTLRNSSLSSTHPCSDSDAKLPSCSDGDSSHVQYPGCLNVNSAEIKCLKGDPGNRCSKKIEKMRRIYLLGLLFYELFSGGERPPKNLHNLASCCGAFVSLCTLTLVENNKDGCSNEAKRRHGPAGNRPSIGLCEISYEYLKYMSVPGPVCSLIFNMLDCVYGDLSGSHCYYDVKDIICDLKLMRDKPSIYLRDLDTESLSLTGLPIDELVISREKELATIVACYHRSISQSSEFVVLKGDSGSGKTWLSKLTVQALATADGALFLSGKFDQLQQNMPFSALSSAFDQYCDVLMREKDSDWVQNVINKFHEIIGEHASHLINVIPKLGQILCVSSRSADTSTIDQNYRNSVQRMHYLICSFVEIISTYSPVPICFWLDDCQWADAASLSVLHQLLKMRRNNLFFLACCRDGEMESDHPVWKVMKNLQSSGINTTTVRVKCMTESELNDKISELLHLPPRLVTSLSSILYHKTLGNMLFIRQILLSLYRDGILRLDLGLKRWAWDEDSIFSMKLPDNVALCFAAGISKLEPDVQSALHTLSLFGASIKLEYIKLLETSLDLKLIDPLNKAVNQGLVTSLKGTYHFAHDRIQQVSYTTVEEKQRLLTHLIYGSCLVNYAAETGDNQLLFVAVNQINLGGPSQVTNRDELIIFASHNLAAGKTATRMADMSSAYKFFHNGIEFLPTDHWNDSRHYQFSLELHELAAKTSLAVGNIERFQYYSDQVINNSRNFEDQLNIHLIAMVALFHASKIPEALEKSISILSQLGQTIPSTQIEVDQCLLDTQILITGVSEDDIMKLPMITNPRKIMVMRFLSRLQYVAYFAKPSLHQFVILKIVQMSITDGLAPMSPVGFASFGSMLAKLGSIQTGCRFLRLGKSLLKIPGASEFVGSIFHMLAEVQCYVEPLRAAMELHVNGEDEAQRVGDAHFCCIHRLCYSSKHFWAGTDLSITRDVVTKASLYMKEVEHKATLFFVLVIKRTIISLIGENSDMPLFSQEGKNPRELVHLYFHDMYLSYMLGNGNLVECTEKYLTLDTEIKSNWLIFADSAQAFIAGLAAYRVFRSTRNTLWADRGKKLKESMSHWAEEGTAWNFEHKLRLMEAEECYSLGDVGTAQKCYGMAIEGAKRHRFVNDLALCYEIAAMFYFGIGEVQKSLEHFRLAHEAYTSWGANGKATQLFVFITETFAPLCD